MIGGHYFKLFASNFDDNQWKIVAIGNMTIYSPKYDVLSQNFFVRESSSGPLVRLG